MEGGVDEFRGYQNVRGFFVGACCVSRNKWHHAEALEGDVDEFRGYQSVRGFFVGACCVSRNKKHHAEVEIMYDLKDAYG